MSVELSGRFDTAHAERLVDVSIVMPCLNEAQCLSVCIDNARAALAMIETRFGLAGEIVVADNGSTDGTRERALSWVDHVPNLRVIDASGRRSASYARNEGVGAAHSENILFCDGDDAVSDTWVASMVHALRTHRFVCGPIFFDRLNTKATTCWGPGPTGNEPPVIYGFLPAALTCNMAIRRAELQRIGGFDEALRRNEDIDLSWRAVLSGVPLAFAFGAGVERRIRAAPVDFWRERIVHSSQMALLYRRFRGRGMRRSPLRDVVYDYAMAVLLLPCLVSRGSRYRWLNVAGLRLGRLCGSLQYRVFYP